MRALGIDPGTVTTGYGIVDEENRRLFCVASGHINTPAKAPLPRRLQTIYQSIVQLIDRYHPHLMVVEDTFLGKNFQAAVKLGQARGVAILAAQERELPLYEYTPTAVKLAVAGYGAARKEQIQQMVFRLLALDEVSSSLHASDALAVAICHLHSAKLREILQRG